MPSFKLEPVAMGRPDLVVAYFKADTPGVI